MTATPDFDRAAIKALDTLIQHNVSAAPVDPLPILKSMPDVLILSFAEMAGSFGVARDSVVTMFGAANQDAATTVSEINGRKCYIVAYNQRLPFYMLQRALARELGHIVLGHDGTRTDEVRTEEALVFARHLLCPRPVVHALQQSGVPLTVETLGNVTGCYERCLSGLRVTPGTHVPKYLNQLVRDQFADYLNNYISFQSAISAGDTSSVADFGTYMDGYEE